jgi:hypothetical protein
MKTKEEIIAVIDNTNHLSCEDCVAIKHHLTQPTLNPMKIDEERLVRAWKTTPSIKEAIKYYNSTCKDHQVLQPLPSDIPAKIGRMICEYARDNNMSIDDIWKEIFDHYGTPTQKELPSVEELDEEICALHRVIMPATSKLIAQHLVNKYGLNPPNRDEFPFNLKRGDLFMNGEFLREFKSIRISIVDIGNQIFSESECTPYIEPSIHDKVKEKLGAKLYEEFMKEVKG